MSCVAIVSLKVAQEMLLFNVLSRSSTSCDIQHRPLNICSYIGWIDKYCTNIMFCQDCRPAANVLSMFSIFLMLSMFCQDCRPAAANFGENGGVVQLLHHGSHESPSENGRRLIFFKLILTVTIKAIFHWLFFINHIFNSIQMYPMFKS